MNTISLATTAYTSTLNGRLAVTAGSSWRRAPAAAFRGFKYILSPLARSRLFRLRNFCWNAFHPDHEGFSGITILSEGTTGTMRGISFIVRTFTVTSSPSMPSPRVTPWVKARFRYVNDGQAIDLRFDHIPGFCHAGIQFHAPCRSQLRRSSALNEFSRLRIGAGARLPS